MVKDYKFWNLKKERFVAFFDIMGFKEMVSKNSHEFVYEKLLKFSDINKSIKEDSIDKMKGSSKQPGSIILPIIFSDSILYISNSNTKDDFDDILFNIKWLLNNCFKNQIPINGALSLGEFTADIENSIYFGQPLIDAYLLQKDLHIYSCIIDNNAEKFINNNYKNIENNDYYDNNFIKFKTPFKNKKDTTHSHVNWIESFVLNKIREDKFELFLNPINIKLNIDKNEYLKNLGDEKMKYINLIERFYESVSGEPRIYIDNTIDFVTHIYNNYKTNYFN